MIQELQEWIPGGGAPELLTFLADLAGPDETKATFASSGPRQHLPQKPQGAEVRLKDLSPEDR
eukprot:880504-Pyramimonas_sp.AAC.1